ncbi:hypothetical protein Prudu_016496 [Prunus dulcis]|uniref:Integrase catalytic domain-containing protein n=1 Tax=Prunus dulcis TaxID=3755 RepID=A0A4Y1RLE6_PRUDU|nr:hypothetical protein Prudu_016496 [Prunus dulcis]
MTRQKVHIFLTGLDVEFEQIREEILRKDPIPELEATYALVRRDSVRRAEGTKSDTTTMIARNRAPNRSSNAQPDRTGSNDRSGCVSGSNRSGRATGSDCSTAPTESTELVLLLTLRMVRIAILLTRPLPGGHYRHVSSLTPSTKPSVSTANGTSASVIGEGSGHPNATNDCYGVRRGKLYYLDLVSDSSKKLAEALIVADSQEEKNQETIWLWHRRLGHASFSYLKKLFPASFSDIGVSKLRCNVCELTKSHRASFDSSLNKSFVPFQIIHSDVWGPSTPSSLGGSQLRNYLESHGIVHQTTCPYTPKQNGVVERKNRHLLEVVRASLIDAHMPPSYWVEALTSATYVINRTPSIHWDFKHRCKALLQPLPLLLSPIYHHIFLDVLFLSIYININGVMAHPRKGSLLSPSIPNHIDDCSNLSGASPVPMAASPVSLMPQSPTSLKAPSLLDLSLPGSSASPLPSPASVSSLPQYGTVQLDNEEALVNSKWKNAMNEKMKSLQKNGTWELVDLLVGKKPVVCMWIHTVKYKADGTIGHFKERLVANGALRHMAIDYMETFALVAKINTVRILLFGCQFELALQQFDVKNAFLHGDLTKEVYMDISPGNDSDEREALKNETGMSACQLVDTPMEEGLKLEIEADQVPTNKGVIRAPGKGILFTKDDNYLKIEGYTDADWVGDVGDRRSTSGYFTFVGGNLVM